MEYINVTDEFLGDVVVILNDFQTYIKYRYREPFMWSRNYVNATGHYRWLQWLGNIDSGASCRRSLWPSDYSDLYRHMASLCQNGFVLISLRLLCKYSYGDKYHVYICNDWNRKYYPQIICIYNAIHWCLFDVLFRTQALWENVPGARHHKHYRLETCKPCPSLQYGSRCSKIILCRMKLVSLTVP